MGIDTKIIVIPFVVTETIIIIIIIINDAEIRATKKPYHGLYGSTTDV